VPESRLAPLPFAPDQSGRRNPRSATGDTTSGTHRCTGWRYVVEELAGAGIQPHVAEPANTAFARGRKRHAKTDKTDSRHLRELLAEGRLPECWILSRSKIGSGR
jgi:hypothetical protein